MRHLICIFIENSKFLNYVHLSSRICLSKIYSGVGGTEQVIFLFFLFGRNLAELLLAGAVWSCMWLNCGAGCGQKGRGREGERRK